MAVSPWVQPNTVTAADAGTYRAQLDNAFAVLARHGAAFAPAAQSTPNMTIRLQAGYMFDGTNLTEVAAQNTGAITAPAANPRIDRVVVDAATGVVSVVTGAENASPVAPAIPAGKIPVARIALAVSTTSIGNSLITDERAIAGGGGGSGAASGTGWVDTVGGTANAITLTPDTAITAYEAGQDFTFLPATDSTNATVTIAVSGLGSPVTVKKVVAGALAALAIGDLQEDTPAQIVHDGTYFILLNPANGHSGTGYVATVGGTANAVTLTPATAIPAYAAGQDFTFLPATDSTNATVTIAVSGLGSPVTVKKAVAGTLSALAVGDLQQGVPARIIHDGTYFVLLNPASSSDGTGYSASVGGTANAITLTPATPLPALATGMAFEFLPASTTTSGTVTANVSGTGTKDIKKSIGGAIVALAVGDLQANVPARMVYDGTQFVLESPRAYSKGADIASAATLNLDAATGDYVSITGATGCTAITLAEGRQITCRFASTPTFTHGASLVLHGAANIVFAAGDIAIFRGEASGVVRMVGGARANGLPYTNPTTTTDNTIPRHDGTGGKQQTSGVVIDDANEISNYTGKFNDQTGSTYTTVDGDTGKILTFSVACAVTLHPAAPKGTCLTWYQKGSGQITFGSSGSGTVVNRQGHTKSAGQRACGTAFVESNAGSAAVWVIAGDTSA